MEITIPGNNCKRIVITSAKTIQDYIRFESASGKNIEWYQQNYRTDSYHRVPTQFEELLEKEYNGCSNC